MGLPQLSGSEAIGFFGGGEVLSSGRSLKYSIPQ